jgi:pantothenate kinase type III
MTKEEILKEQYFSDQEIKNKSGILKAMEKYAEQEVKNCNIPVVRERLTNALKSVCEKHHEYGEDEIYIGKIHNGEINVKTFDAEELIDEILNAL